MVYRDNLSSYIKELIQKTSNDSRLVNQFIANEKIELNDNINTIEDIAKDKDINIIKGLYHRYPNKILIFPTERCLGSCRFCFRKNIIADNDLQLQDMDVIQKYILDNKIEEVIFSGGDSFAIDEKLLMQMIERIRNLDTVKIIRLHTRVLTYNPYLISENFVKFLKHEKPIYMVFHINSHLEITDIAKEKVKLLVDNGILCFSQTALLKGVNDTTEDLKQLFTTLIEERIKPYYLFHPDRVKGTGHFYISLSKGIELYNSLYNYISGLAMPIYLFNIPNGHGHCIIDLNNIKRISGDKYQINTWEGYVLEYDDSNIK